MCDEKLTSGDKEMRKEGRNCIQLRMGSFGTMDEFGFQLSISFYEIS